MAYAVTNPPRQTLHGAEFGAALWLYSTADAAAVVDTAGYITNARKLGMKKGDIVIRTTWSALPTAQSDLDTAAATSPTVSTMGFHIVLGISADGSADLADTLALTATNTD